MGGGISNKYFRVLKYAFFHPMTINTPATLNNHLIFLSELLVLLLLA